MRADDLRFDELFTFRDGVIDFQGRRLVLHSADAFAQFRKDLYEMVGARQARRILTRYSYFWGQADAAAMRRVFSWSSPLELVKAGRVGDLVHITKVFIESDKLVLQINGGFNGGRKWYEGAQIGGGIGGGGSMTPLGKGDSNAPGGTTIEILFHKPLEPMKAAEVKKMLAPVLDFEKRSATVLYAEVLPPEVQ